MKQIPRLGECGIAMQQGSEAKARPSDLNLPECPSASDLEELQVVVRRGFVRDMLMSSVFF